MSLLLLLSIATGCTHGSPADGHTSGPSTEETAEPSDSAPDTDTDTDSTGAFADIAATVDDDVVTVVKVTWSTDEAAEGWVEYGETSAYGLTTPAQEAATTHEALLLGLPGETAAHFRVHATLGGEDVVSGDRTITTGAVPNTLPHVTVTGALTGWMLVPYLGVDSGLMIVDGRGRVVWYRDGGDYSYQTRAALARDGTELLSADYWEHYGGIVRTTFEGDAESTHIDGMRHDLVELPDGTVTVLAGTNQRVGPDLTDAWGDTVLEVAPDGTQTTIWSAWDWFDPLDVCGDDTTCLEDWTHANAIDYDEAADAYYVNLHHLGGIAKIDRSTGELLWMISGGYGDFTFLDGSPQFDLSHQFDFEGDELLVFNNGGYPVPSSIDDYVVDYDAMTVTQQWSWQNDEPLEVAALGSADFLDDGAFLANWGTAGMIQLVGGDGEVRWQMVADFGYAFGYGQYIQDFYAR